MRLLVASVVCVLLALSFPGIVSKLEDNITACGDFFFEDKSPVIPGILEDSVTQDNRYKIICQKYKNKIRFATIYDTTNRIPVFSAYKYTGTNNFTRPEIPRIWRTESQLEPSDAEMQVPFSKQARNQDYWIKDTCNCTHGTLFPINHTADTETANSTFTLTNSVPERSGFREEIWNVVEKTTKEVMDRYCRDNNNNIVAYVLTGAVPSKASKLNNRVNIPSNVWTAFCCYNRTETSWVSKTFKAENKAKNVTITLKSLEILQSFLTKELGVNVELFKNNCDVVASQFRCRNLRNQWLRSMSKCIRAARRRPSLVLECHKMHPSPRMQCRRLIDHDSQLRLGFFSD
ncbi:endonuclease domain-containing 1 protein-like [Triplophysa rosa]|uniref:Endonuclease domain-containing 1 protein n=1 Tax=Triplophysa rosa TaxID=992332 RepID=A0A9W7T2A3_TRIRA|nr:endonuclease domain-containing 1 protein-like [Triplophysa rosa]KAI7789985.1 putative endonuclease domain-containing 1 protein [Triplophysa rosa]